MKKDKNVSQVYTFEAQKSKCTLSPRTNRVIKYLRRNGFFQGIVIAIEKTPVGKIFYKYFFRDKTFCIDNKEYHYFIHNYNKTWLNERTIELPFMLNALEKNKNLRILEIGNVLQNYTKISHDVLDKYEFCSGVINEDIVSFKPKKKYDLIFCISTLEHIGYDEDPQVPERLLVAISKMKTILNEGGKIILSIPMGHNKYLDAWIRTRKINLSKKICMKRISRLNLWAECSYSDIISSKYNHPFRSANGVIIGIINKK